MAVEALFTKASGRLVPYDRDAVDALAAVPRGTILKIKWTRPRNIKHHRKLFVLLQLVVEATDRYSYKESLLDALKVATGHYRVWKVGNREYLQPLSISFSAMDQDAFEDFYSAVVNLISTEILPEVDREDLEREVNDLLEGGQMGRLR